jgi:hypothetical protein
MSVDSYRLAQELANEAERLSAAGHESEAAELWRRAAVEEDRTFWLVPSERGKTRGIVATAAVSMLRRAGDLSAAALLARRYFAETGLPTFVEDQLLGLLLEQRRTVQAHLEGGRLGSAYEIVLRGSGVKAGGLVSLDTVLLKLEQFRGYMLRVGEWMTDQPFRERGPVADAVVRGVVPLVSPAAVGSYRFEIRVQSEDVQLAAFDDVPNVTPEEIGKGFFRILSATVDGGPDGLAATVGDPRYQSAFLRLVRGLAPTGKELDEIEVAPKEDKRIAVLRPELRRSITRHLDATRQKPKNETTRFGVLRALDLDAGTLVLRESGIEQSCKVKSGLLDDVVGPLVNHRVRVLGETTGRTFYVSEIDEAGDDEGTSATARAEAT